MKRYLYLLLNNLQHRGWIDYKKFLVSNNDFHKPYFQKTHEALKKQSLPVHNISLNTILFQANLQWKYELGVQYLQSPDFHYQYSVAAYNTHSFICIEQFQQEQAKITACFTIPKYWGILIKSWIIFQIISKQLTQNTAYCKDPMLLRSQTPEYALYQYFLPSILKQKRDIIYKESRTRGSVTFLYGETNQAGIYYPPKRLHEENCPFIHDDIGRQECLFCAQKLTIHDADQGNFQPMTDWEFIDYMNQFLPDKDEYWTGPDSIKNNFYNELRRRSIDPGILTEHYSLNMKCKVRLKNKKLILKK